MKKTIKDFAKAGSALNDQVLKEEEMGQVKGGDDPSILPLSDEHAPVFTWSLEAAWPTKVQATD